MPRLQTFDKNKALSLYRELKSDLEISQNLEVPKETIVSWRRRNNLPTIAPRKPRSKNPPAEKPKSKPIVKKQQTKHTPKPRLTYRDVLSAEQAKEMHQFLKALSAAGRKAVESGFKPDVGAAINEWRRMVIVNYE